MGKKKRFNFLYRFDISESKEISKKEILDEILEEIKRLNWDTGVKTENYIKYGISKAHGKYECKTELEKTKGGILARTEGTYNISIWSALSMCAFCGLATFFMSSKIEEDKENMPKDQIRDVLNNVSIKLGLK